MPADPVSAETATLNYSTVASTVALRAGGSLPITGPLLNPAYPPRGGWYVVIPVAGHSERVNGGSQKEVFRNARELLDRNGTGVSDKDLWLNLSLQWLSQDRLLKPHMHQVTLEGLMAVTTGNEPPVVAHAAKANTSPKEWGAKGWGALQVELSQDTYDYREFLTLAVRVGQWVNPDVNPSIGCADCYRHYIQALAEVRSRQISKEEARQWLWRTMNAVNRQNGKRELTFAEAAAINHWT